MGFSRIMDRQMDIEDRGEGRGFNGELDMGNRGRRKEEKYTK